MKIIVTKGKKRKTFRTVKAAKRWTGKARKVSVIVLQ